MASETVKNTIANISSRMWTMIANFLFVPLYIKFLGAEAYGLVTFFSTLQTVLNLLGFGLSKTLRREFAADETTEKNKLYKYKVLRTVEFFYGIVGLVIIGICVAFSDRIAKTWLTVETLEFAMVSETISLMGISIAAQLLANLYLGCLLGIDLQIKANMVQIGWSAVKNIGVIVVISCICSDVRAFYLWYGIIDLLYMFLVRRFVISYLRHSEEKLSWEMGDLKLLKSISKFALGIMVISLGYVVNTQIDKVLISGSFSLTEVGAYNTAYNLSYVVSAFASAIGVSSFSKFARLFSLGEIELQKKTYVKLSTVTSVWLCSLGGYAAIFSQELILVWTGDETIAYTVKMVAPLIIMGTMFNALQELTYEFLLASGTTILNNVMTIGCIGYVLTITPRMIKRWGLFGAGVAWIIEMGFSTLIFLFVFYMKYFKGEVFKRIIKDFAIPIVFSLASAMVVRWLSTGMEVYIKVIIAMISGLITFAVLLLFYDRETVMNIIMKKKG